MGGDLGIEGCWGGWVLGLVWGRYWGGVYSFI